MQTNPSVVDNRHTTTDICRVGTKRRVQREAAVSSARSLDVVLTAYDDELERVEVFKYLRRLLAFDDNDMRAVRGNIKKACKSWRMLSRLLRAESIPSRVCGMFYQAVVQAILLFGSETWALTPSTMNSCLKGFHIRSTYRMARVNKPRKDPHAGEWTYPSSEIALEEVGLKPIRHYIEVWRQTITG
ncbi:hypothetical protein ACHAXR_008089 [Thalassiosira sp. AJA248-18]